MGDVRLLIRRLGLGNQSEQVEAKAMEYVRRATAKLGRNALGQAEVCKAAVCVDLACMTLQVPLNTETIAKCSGTSKLSYANARVTLQKALCVRSNPTARDLCIQFGCARLEAAVRATLASYKQRFAASLPECQRGNLDFSRPVFLAASFYLIARKNRVKVSRERLLSTLGITGTELNATVASITALLPEVVAQQERKRRADRENTAGGDASGSESGSDEADAGDAPAAGSRGGRKKQRAGEDRGLEENALEQAGVEKPERRRTRLTEKKLRQAVLQFGGGAENEKVTAV